MDMYIYVLHPRRNLEETLNALIEKQEINNTQNAQTTLNFQEKGKLPFNHDKIPKDNTIQVQVAREANTCIKSNQFVYYCYYSSN